MGTLRRLTEAALEEIDRWADVTGKTWHGIPRDAAGMFMASNARALVDEVRAVRELLRDLKEKGCPLGEYGSCYWCLARVGRGEEHRQDCEWLRIEALGTAPRPRAG